MSASLVQVPADIWSVVLGYAYDGDVWIERQRQTRKEDEWEKARRGTRKRERETELVGEALACRISEEAISCDLTVVLPAPQTLQPLPSQFWLLSKSFTDGLEEWIILTLDGDSDKSVDRILRLAPRRFGPEVRPFYCQKRVILARSRAPKEFLNSFRRLEGNYLGIQVYLEATKAKNNDTAIGPRHSLCSSR
jgi:hypothetical protein